MDPITTTFVYCFIGYYIGSDLCNYIKFSVYFKDIAERLERIETHLNDN
jgi:hypothetical protein